MKNVISNNGWFKVKNNKILLFRMGSANGQLQRHFYKPVNINGKKLETELDIENWKTSIRKPPTRKGIFTFPAPFNDAFYYAHFYEQFLPKYYKNHGYVQGWKIYGVYRNINEEQELKKFYDEDRKKFYSQLNVKYQEIIKRHKIKTIWHGGTFYSHICPKHLIDDGRSWWKYDNISEWINSARKYIWEYYGYDTKNIHKFSGKMWVDPGHFELFIPS